MILCVVYLVSKPAFSKCIVGGCSGQLCVPEGQDAITNCLWLEKYSCYRVYGQCVKQESGKCAWKQSQELQDCLRNPSIITP